MTTVQNTAPRPAPTGPGEQPAGTPVISVRGLWKVFGPRAAKLVGSELASLPPAELRERTGRTVAVRDVTFDVRASEVFVVMGLSGSGKSTLVRCLSRLIEPTAGEVLLDGENLRQVGRRRLREIRRRKLAMVFQHFGLFDHRRVLDNVAYGLEVAGVGRKKRYARAREVLALVGLEGCDDHLPHQLSGGMKQRVGLARALAVDPEVLLFDEPFSALDPLIRRDMRAEVCRLQRELARTMVFITHDLAEALELGDRVAIMRDGAVVQVGTPEQVVAEPVDDYVRDFCRDVPRADVLTVRTLARPARVGDALDDAPTVAASSLLRDAVPMVADAPLVRVVAGGEGYVGVLERRRLLDVLAGREGG